MRNHRNYLEEIAPRAAELNGQDWASVHATNKQIIRDGVRDVTPGGGQTVFEKACGQATAEWYEKQRTAVTPKPEPKPAPKPKAPKQSKN